jgi:hypothetical protein
MPRPSNLASIPTEALVQELKRRFAAIEEAKKELLGSGVSVTHSASSGDKDAKRSQAAKNKWAAWPEYKAGHPIATTQDYHKWRKQQKKQKS